jgi:nitrile hydratase accessory protein
MRSSLIWSLPDVSGDPQSVPFAAEANAGLPGDGGGPVFPEPWEARAFALALALQESGLFSWEEWARALGEEIRKAQAAGDPDTGHNYYRHWVATLERIVAEKGVTTAHSLARYARAWDHAADRTPHGMPIELRREDF